VSRDVVMCCTACVETCRWRR